MSVQLNVKVDENTADAIKKLTAGQFFLLIKVMQNLVGREDEAYFAELVERADNMGIEFMQLKMRRSTRCCVMANMYVIPYGNNYKGGANENI